MTSLELAYQCTHCASPLIVHHAHAQWRVDLQRFDIVKVSSRARCLSCDATFTFIAPIELTDEVIQSYARVNDKLLEEVS